MPSLLNYMAELTKIRALNIVPQGLNLSKKFFETLSLSNLCHITFTHLMGQSPDGAVLINATENNSLQTVISGSGFTTYTTDSTTPPSAFSASAEIEVVSGFHRIDILVESQDVEIRFQLPDGTWGDAIPIKVGNASIDFTSSKIQWKYRSTSGGTIHVTAWS